MALNISSLYCVILLNGSNYWQNGIACYTEQFQFLLMQLPNYFPNLMGPPFSYGSQNRTVASVIVVCGVPGLR